jgi:hypothetical protein
MPPLPVAPAVSGPLDGIFWQRLDAMQQAGWAAGWMAGLATGELIASEDGSNRPYRAALDRLSGLTVAEILSGLNQLYGADYRNLKIDLRSAALFVARYSREGMTKAGAQAQLERLREQFR